MAGQDRVLLIGPKTDQAEKLVSKLENQFQCDHFPSIAESLHNLSQNDYAGLLLLNHNILEASRFLEASGLLEQIPEGIVLLDIESDILWSNQTFQKMTVAEKSIIGENFYDAFGAPEILGPDFGPFQTVLATGESTKSTLLVGLRTYFEIHVKPVFEDPQDDVPNFLIVTVRDISEDILEHQKLSAIHQAGLELGDITPQELLEMSVNDRIELLKSKILHYTQDLLEFETVEIRLVDPQTQILQPLLAVGMTPDATGRVLYAKPQGNGVTGFVGATGKSYLCEDIQSDPLYIAGAPDARSSLTVPLILHEEILGTFNVESARAGAFHEQDLKFLELFSREVALALNTLELLVAEKMTSVTENTAKISREAANHVDEILNDAAWVLERYIGHEPTVCERLQRILKHTRDIKQVIQEAGEAKAPQGALTPFKLSQKHPMLQKKRILCVDADQSVRHAAHEMLGRYGCDVETAHNGEEALLMVRSFHYDVAIIDIRLDDMDGYECYQQLKGINDHLPIILMTGFGYDPTHSIVKARQDGLKSVLYKPFRMDQLLEALENSINPAGDAEEN